MKILLSFSTLLIGEILKNPKTIIRLKSDQGTYLAVNEQNQIALTTEVAANSAWQVVENGDSGTIQLKNVKTGKGLNRIKKGAGLNQYNLKSIGTKWTVHGNIIQSSKISLESFKNDFLYSGENM